MKKILLFFLFLNVLLSAKIYYVYVPLESDTILTAWLIHRYQDSNATFVGVNKGSAIDAVPDQQINTPNGTYRRTSHFTAYEFTRHKFGINSKCSQFYDRISRILEMAFWQRDEFPKIVVFQRKLHDTLPKKTGVLNLNKTFKFLDTTCKKGEL